MKVRVNIEGKWFDVEVDSVKTKPVVARVNGETVEVWLDEEALKNAEQIASGQAARATQSVVKEIRAPIPGTILSIAVRAGDEVSYGDELCILEAMKMKNLIRSPRAGLIDRILVTPGQTVKHNEVLVVFQA